MHEYQEVMHQNDTWNASDEIIHLGPNQWRIIVGAENLNLSESLREWKWFENRIWHKESD